MAFLSLRAGLYLRRTAFDPNERSLGLSRSITPEGWCTSADTLLLSPS